MFNKFYLYIYTYICVCECVFKTSSSKLDVSKEHLSKEIYKVLLSKYAMHLHGLRFLQAYQSVCGRGQILKLAQA